MEETLRENKMGTAPVPSLMIKMALPIIVSMLVQALYNVVDSIFVAQLNENALTAVSMAFPYQQIMIAISIGTCVGANALVSRSLGEREFELANNMARHGLFLALCSYIVLAVVSIFLIKPFMHVQVSDADVQIFEYGVEYLNICCLGSFGLFFAVTFEKLLNSTGKTSLTMISQTLGAVFNIVMDPVLIFGYFGLPAMGVAGAAIATIGGQTLGAGVGLFLNHKFNKELNLNMRGFRPRKHIILEIYKIGVPSIILQCIGSFTQVLMNQLLVSYTSTATAVYGVSFKLNSFAFFPIFGMNNALVPVVAFNYGAKHRKRVKTAIITGEVFALSVMAIGMVAFVFFPRQLLQLFNASESMMEIGIPALRIIGIVFPTAGFSVIMGSFMQAVGDAVYGMINSFARQIVVLLPAAYLLSKNFGLGAIWWAFPIAEVVATALTVFFFIRVYRKKIAHMPD